MVVETWVITIAVFAAGRRGEGLGSALVLRLARLLRLMRIARMVRVLRSMPEPLILTKGMAAATRSLCYALVLIVIQMYVFGTIFKNLTQSTTVGSEFFDSVGSSMYTLMIYGTFLDNVGVLFERLGESNFGLAALFMLFAL